MVGACNIYLVSRNNTYTPHDLGQLPKALYSSSAFWWSSPIIDIDGRDSERMADKLILQSVTRCEID